MSRRHDAADPDAFPTRQLFVLAICRFSEPIAFVSILSYSFVMVKDLGVPDKDASFYSGLLVSAYAVAETMTMMGWGALSDRVGRKPVVLSGLVGVALSSLIFGLAQSYWVALAARFLGGALNGNLSVMQTMVAEMVRRPEHEPRAYAVQPFVWTLGSIVGAAMGGFLAQPATFYPGVFPRDGLFGRYPYLLPNLVSVVVILMAVVQGALFLEETRTWDEDDEGDDGGQAVEDDDDVTINEETPLCNRDARKRTTSHGAPLPLPVDEHNANLRRSSFGTVHSIKPVLSPTPSSTPSRQPSPSNHQPPPEKIFNSSVVTLIVTLIIYSYHQMAAKSLLPTHLLDSPAAPPGHLDLRGGLGLTVHDVGTYLSVNGVVGMLTQIFVFPVFVERVGVRRSLVSMVLLHPLCYVLMPFLRALPESLVPAGVYLSLVMQSFCAIIIFPVTLILLKDATPSKAGLGRVNGLALSGACFARTLSSPVVGIVYSVGGSGAAWFSCAGAAVLGVAQLMWLPRVKRGVDRVVVDSPMGGEA